jgi:thiamine biosynthesis lipoprotein
VTSRPAVADHRIEEVRFPVMGTVGHVVVIGGEPGAAHDAVARLEQLEARWSRFRPDSEISRLNRSPGEPTAVSTDTILLARRSLQAWRATNGAFDPTVHGAINALGYDRSFEQLTPSFRSAPVGGPTDRRAPGMAAIAIDPPTGTITVPVGTGLDPGGIGKGLAADLVVGEQLAAGAAGVCINLGGDVRVKGAGPPPQGWQVGVEHPYLDGELVAVIGLTNGAVATSSRLRRTWVVDDQRRHHLLDPATGRPTEGSLDSVTVVAGEGWWAEAITKAAFVAGAERAAAVIDGLGATGLYCTDDGQLHELSGLSRYLG